MVFDITGLNFVSASVTTYRGKRDHSLTRVRNRMEHTYAVCYWRFAIPEINKWRQLYVLQWRNYLSY